MSKHKVKSAAAALPIPQSDAAAAVAIREVGDLSRKSVRLQTELNDKIAALREEYGEQLAPLKADIQLRQEGLQVFCNANRDRLTKNGKVKFFNFSTGIVSWRSRPASVTVRGKDAVIAAIEEAGLSDRFLRVKKDVNKEAMLEDAEAARGIKGISIGSGGEDFIVEPFDTEIAEEV